MDYATLLTLPCMFYPLNFASVTLVSNLIAKNKSNTFRSLTNSDFVKKISHLCCRKTAFNSMGIFHTTHQASFRSLFHTKHGGVLKPIELERRESPVP